MRLLTTTVVLVAISAAVRAESGSPSAASAGAEIIDRYVSAVQAQESRPQSVSMEVDIDAKLPRLKKTGRFHALKFITRLGQIFYRTPRYEGDNTIKKEVIARYLRAESEARSEYAGSLSVTPANYKFKYKGMGDYAGQPAYVFQVSPREKRVGLFKGEIWVDRDTFLPLRQWGELVKNPSVFLKNVYFVRDYVIWDGRSVPRRLISDVDTRLVGKAQLVIWFDNYKAGDPDVSTSAMLGGGNTTASTDSGSQH